MVYNNLTHIKSCIIGSLYRIKKSSFYLDSIIIKDINKKSYEDIKKILINKNIIYTIYKLLYSSYNYLSNTYGLKGIKKPYLKQSRIFLSHILIYTDPKSVLGEENTRTLKTRKLHKEAIMLFNYFKILCKKPTNKPVIYLLMKQFNNYMHTFLEWQKSDKEQLIGKMAHNYWELEITKRNIGTSNQKSELVGVLPQPDNRDEILKSLIKMQNDVLKNVKRLDKNSMSIFNQYIPIVYSEDFMENVRDTLDTVFWDNIRKDMGHIPIKTDRFKAVLQELLDNLRTICVHDITYQNDLTEFYDIELLLQMIRSRVYSFNNLKVHFFSLIDVLIRFDAPINDIRNKELNQSIMSRLEELENNPLSYYSSIVEGWLILLKELLPCFISINKIKNKILKNNI